MATSEKFPHVDQSEPRVEVKSGQRRGIVVFFDKNRRALSALLVFVALMLIFTIASPDVFLSTAIYTTVFKSLPIRIILAVPLVFVIAAGESDLSFAGTLRALHMGICFNGCCRLEPFSECRPRDDDRGMYWIGKWTDRHPYRRLFTCDNSRDGFSHGGIGFRW